MEGINGGNGRGISKGHGREVYVHFNFENIINKTTERIIAIGETALKPIIILSLECFGTCILCFVVVLKLNVIQ